LENSKYPYFTTNRTTVLYYNSMRRDKQIAIDLRRQGKSYREIEKALKISRGTLSAWFKGQDWANEISKKNSQKQWALGHEKMKRLNMMRRVKFAFNYGLAEEEAVKEFEVYKNEPLFNAGLMLYVGEGEKASKPALRVANSDFDVHRVYIRFLERYLKVNHQKVRIFLHIYPDLDEKTCIDRWSKELNLNHSQFYKTQRIQGKDMKRKLQFGVGTTIISSTALKRKLFVWIKLAFEMYGK
jgi:hypothetical protein